MKKKFEEKLKKDFPKRRDGQKTTLELIPELGTFVEPFFPKGPPPGAMRPGGPGGAPPNPVAGSARAPAGNRAPPRPRRRRARASRAPRPPPRAPRPSSRPAP